MWWSKARRPFSWQDLLLERVNLAIPYSYTLDQYQSRVSCLYHNLQYILMDRARTSLELIEFCLYHFLFIVGFFRMKEEQESWILQSYIIRKRKTYRFPLNKKRKSANYGSKFKVWKYGPNPTHINVLKLKAPYYYFRHARTFPSPIMTTTSHPDIRISDFLARQQERRYQLP